DRAVHRRRPRRARARRDERRVRRRDGSPADVPRARRRALSRGQGASGRPLGVAALLRAKRSRPRARRRARADVHAAGRRPAGRLEALVARTTVRRAQLRALQRCRGSRRDDRLIGRVPREARGADPRLAREAPRARHRSTGGFMTRSFASIAACAALAACSPGPESGPAPAAGGTDAAPAAATPQPAAAPAASPRFVEWPAYNGNLASHRYSPLDQIDRSNVTQLDIAWRWQSGNYGPRPEARNEATPLMIGGVLYTTAGMTRNVVALDAATGETLWLYRPNDGERYARAPRKTSGRGLAYWTDGGYDERLFLVTPGFYLIALDPRTGRQVPGFGEGGVVDLMVGVRGEANEHSSIGNSSPAIVVGDVVIVGPAHDVAMRS